jgi:hypothetical protein
MSRYACKDRSCGADDCVSCYPSQEEVGAYNRVTPRSSPNRERQLWDTLAALYRKASNFLDAECYELHAAELALEGSRDDSLSDTQLLNFLETLFSGRFRNSVFICKDIFGDGLVLDTRSQCKVHKATTVRELLQQAAKFEGAGKHE